MNKRLFVLLFAVLGTLGLTVSALGDLLPDDWSLSGTGITATQETGTVHGGMYSCNLTWTATSTRSLEQSVSVIPGGDYALSLHVYDDDPDGRVRGWIKWYDCNGNYISNDFGDVYTTDQASWQLITSGSYTSPLNAVSALVQIRCYDVIGWDGDATVYIDDARFDTCCDNVLLNGDFESWSELSADTLTIYDVQYNETTMGSGNDCYPSPHIDEYVVISGTITASISSYTRGFWLQDDETSWSGVFVYDYTVSPSRGDSVTITAEVDEYYGMTEIIHVSDYAIHSSGNPEPAPLHITTGDLSAGCNANSEAYEGVLVRVTNAVCTQEANSYGEWYVDDGSGECQIDDDLYSYHPILGEQFGDIIGVVDYSYDQYEILPRDEYDLQIIVSVQLASFEATAGDGQVTLIWRTSAEVNTHSFNIYRDDEVIASVPAFGDAHDYIYVDRQVTNGANYTYQLSDIDLDGTETIHSLVCSVTPNAVPVSYALAQNYPNPFNPSTEISYAIPADAHVTLTVYNLLGQEMVTLVDDTKSAGRHTISWNAADNASGVYFYRLQTDDFSATKKMVFMK